MKVRQYVRANSGAKEEADDLFQDAVVILFQYVKEGKFNEKYDIDAFVFSVARNLWINKKNKEKQMQKYADTVLNEPVLYDDSYLDLINKEKTSILAKLIEELGERCKELLNLHLYERLSMKEISVQLGYENENVAKTKNYKCKQRLIQNIKSNPEIIEVLRN